MRRLRNQLRERLPDAGDDTGAALLLVLLVVTVIGLGAGAILALETTGMRTTIAIRDQGASAYAADGAAQVAIGRLEQATSAGDACTAGIPLGTSGNAFYSSPAPSTAASLNAYVSCATGAGGGTGGPTSANASPGNALLTLGTGTGGENGIDIYTESPVKVRGGVFSNSTIDINSGGLQNTLNNPPSLPYTIARGNCTNPNLITPAANRTCNYSAADTRGTDPGLLTPHGASYDQPPAPTANGTIGTCAGGATYQRLTPGRFRDATLLSNLTGCSKKLVQFTPGTYFFDFVNSGSHVWTVDRTYVVAGTPTIPLTVTPSVAQMPTACVLPEAAAATTTSGVRFVFGGDSQIQVLSEGNPGGQLTICASKSANGPPVAVSSVKTAVTGTFAVSAQNGCVTNPPPISQQCGLIYTDNSPNTTLTIQGTTYLPKAGVVLTLNSSRNQVFRWGLIARGLLLFTTGDADHSVPLVDVPDTAASPTPIPDVMYLSVYVCPGTSTCTASGTLRLRAKVKLDSVTPRTAKVLGWSIQR